MKLTDRQVELLSSLYYGRARIHYDYGEVGWMRPMDCGACDSSYHSSVLAQLVRKGLVEKSRRGGWVRGSWRYRITTVGVAMYEKVRASR